MKPHSLPTGDTLVLSGRVPLSATPQTPLRAKDAGAARLLEIFHVVSSNVPMESEPGSVQVHIELPSGFFVGTPDIQAAICQMQHMLSACLPELKCDLETFRLCYFTGISRLSQRKALPSLAGYRYILACDVTKQAEAELNQWYSEEHLPGLASVPGVRQARRDVCENGSPRYRACYDIDHPGIVGCEAWLKVRHTSWSSRMIPHMMGIQRTMLKRVVTIYGSDGAFD